MKVHQLLVSALALATALPVLAQMSQPNELPTNLPHATTIVAPDASFDPLAASDEELAYNGFPPRPNQGNAPEAFASWVKAMRASKMRVAPILKHSGRFSGPARIAKKTASSTAAEGSLASSNWSGYVNLSGSAKYGGGSFYYVFADFLVPVASQPFGVCTGTWDYAVSWVGIDGWNSPDVLQAGFEDDAYCHGSLKATYYAPWFEWFPNDWTNITNLPIVPGDELFVVVWNTSPTKGHAYLANENTNQAVSITFSAPAGTSLVGNSAEWIVERPAIDNVLATMTNYVADPFWESHAVTFWGESVEPGSSSSSPIIGLDNNYIADSYPKLLGPSAFVMQTEGSAH